MSRPAAPLPNTLGVIFTPAQARERGVTPGRLRARDLEQPFRGVRRVRPVEPDKNKVEPDKDKKVLVRDEAPLAIDRAQRARVLRRAEAYLPVMPQHAFFAGRTALVIYDLPVSHPGALEVASFTPHRAPRRKGIRGRKASPTLTVVRTARRKEQHWRVASPISAWAMLAAELSVRELIIIGDAIVRVPRDEHGHPQPQQAHGTVAQISATVEAGPRPHQRKLRLAAQAIRIGCASPLETEYRLDAETAQLPEPEFDVEIRDVSGRLLGITEVAYPRWKTLIEIEGDHHRTSRQQWHRDIEKYAAYVAEGWEVVRLTSDHIRGEHPRAARIVREVLIRRGWRP